MKRYVPSIRFCVPTEFLVCHLTKPSFQSLPVNEPVDSRVTRSEISLDLTTKVSHRWLSGCCCPFEQQTTHHEREEHRITTADNDLVSSKTKAVSEKKKTVHAPATSDAPPKKGEFGRPRSTCPLDFGLPIGHTPEEGKGRRGRGRHRAARSCCHRLNDFTRRSCGRTMRWRFLMSSCDRLF